MRGVALLALLVGCGRFGFDPTEGVTKGDDGSVIADATTVDLPSGTGTYAVTEMTVPYAAPANALVVPGFDMTADDNSFEIALPFPFVFYGVPFTTAFANTNGFLTFGAAPASADSFANDCPLDETAPDALIAVFWDDLLFKDTVTTTALSTAVAGTAPDRTFTIEWRDLDAFFRAGTGNNNFSQGIKVTQSIVLHETGVIDLHYGPRTAPNTDRDCGLTRHEGCSATVGLEASGSGLTTPIQCGTETGPAGTFTPLVEGRLIRFTPN
jgi:hypothetical protein